MQIYNRPERRTLSKSHAPSTVESAKPTTEITLTPSTCGRRSRRRAAAEPARNKHAIRDAVGNLDPLENIHPLAGAHSGPDVIRQGRHYRVVHKDTRRETWLTDGHRNLFCECGHDTVEKKFLHTTKGRLVPRLEGKCKSCGPITVTSGDWKLSGGKWRHRSTHPGGTADLLMGNPLTFTNPLSVDYRKRRYGVQENVHSILTYRFGLLREKNHRIKHLEDVRLQTAMTFCALHGITYARALAAGQPQSPSVATSPQLRKAA